MNKQMKNAMVAIIILLVSACGQLETTSTPVDLPVLNVAFTENPASTPESVVASDPVEITPTVVAVGEANAGKNSRYIGLSYWSLPEGLSRGFGMLIQAKDGYGLSLVSDGANKMLWLEKIAQYDSNGNPYWMIKDVLDLSNLEADVILIPDGCFLNREPDSEIIVVAENGVTLLAWRANTTLDVFEAIPTTGIECHSDKGMRLE